MPCDSATCHDLPRHTWLSSHSSLPGQPGACWEDTANPPPQETQQESSTWTQILFKTFPHIHYFQVPPAPVEPSHSSYGSARLILDKTQCPLLFHNQYYGNNNFHNGSGEVKWNYYVRKNFSLHLLQDKQHSNRALLTRLELPLQFFIMFSV